MTCRSECCDEAEESNYGRSHLYFDGQVTDIDYDKLKDMFFDPSTAQPNNNKNKQRIEEEEVSMETSSSPHHDHGRANKRARSAPPAFDSLQGRLDFVRGCLNASMTSEEPKNSAALSAV